MGFGHRVYRAEDPRSRILKRTAKELGAPQVEVAEELEQVALKALQERHPERVLATNVEYYSAIVLDVAEIPPPLAPAMFACSRVAGWSAHILEQKRTGRLFRPSAEYVGPAERSLDVGVTLAEAAGRPTSWRGRARSASSPTCGASGRTRSRRRRARRTTANARSPTGRSASSASGRRPSFCAAGSRTRARPAAARRYCRWSSSPATHRARSTPSARSCTRLRTRTTTRPSGGWRSCACGTARPSATRSSCCRESPTKTGSSATSGNTAAKVAAGLEKRAKAR